MKETRSRKNAVCLILLAAFLLFGIGVYQPLLSPISEYQYPITSDSADWKSYTVHEKVEMLKIPDSILTRLTDKALVQAVAKYPYLIDIGAYDNIVGDYDGGIQSLMKYSSAVNYLLSKKNAADILERYSAEVVAELKEDNPYKYIGFCFPEYALGKLTSYARRSVNYPPFGVDVKAYYKNVTDEELLNQVIECRFLAVTRFAAGYVPPKEMWQRYFSESCPPLYELLSRETAEESLRIYGPNLIAQCAAAQEGTAQRDSLEALECLFYSYFPELQPEE